MTRRLLLLSTSTVHGSEFLGYCQDAVRDHFQGLDHIIFVPYARPSGISFDQYTTLVAEKLAKLPLKVKGLHEFSDPRQALLNAQGVYVGGGNTFLLLKTLYETKVLEVIRKRVLEDHIPYMGSSAGTNVACPAINNTNDMPIVYPPSLNALDLIGFNINPHYLDPDPSSKHKGETRETRIREFHFQSNTPVLGLREGSWLEVHDHDIHLRGELTARLFMKGKEPQEVDSGMNLNFLEEAGMV